MDGWVVHFPESTSYLTFSTGLPAQTRLRFSLAMAALATAGIFMSNCLEEVLPVPPKDASKSA